MSPGVTLAHPGEGVAGLVVLTVYARADLAVCSRVLQTFTVRQFAVERLVADLSRFDHRAVKGLEDVRGPVMRIALVLSLQREDDLERAGKLLNRVVDVYKVEQTFKA
ncbi:hypothetical protein KVF89_02110 [Nocardioides carbamazepini]|uniref:hypothetical protein n=1 Tax=Nocardioides carbamazepini TaxID=2854259 RepID=UPI00214A0D0F|nr:hypothetical protein [Nocardioides carbamazepini]MCR1781315.1 hypothetical protein [Nocardioides carbamazepini]